MMKQGISRWKTIGPVLLAALILIAIGSFAIKSFAQGPNELIVHTKTGAHHISIEWARTESERERGLMERKSMPDDHGMLFDFGVEQPVSFWMKNTPLPLDMVFITAGGTVYRIEKKATPFSEDVIPGGAPVRYVLELVGGVSDKIGLVPGDRFKIPRG
jgi:uncharacterized membrane protein (UPF0127 family)